ncbi:YciI family protein [Shewanella inventionis]|uniref:YCII-related domain-containing protein n=1 Tax=Shewanella inventionis TaxID=1738770 RepID=A0ABQ1JJB9_9GAMM|nr:YciI family protein [Shewanella inventionis]MCL1159641.1 YciI family protein [Shewanella inventionis]GGB70467.1 hypothetical protein GCM10011607_33780 [Shewanella inventionis]
MKLYTNTLTSLLMMSAMVSAPLMAQSEINPQYDQARAAKAGADEYGMKRYVMAFLKRGPNRDRTKAEADELQRLHMANIGRLAEAGKLVLAGPFLDNGELRGIYIFDVETIEQAKQLTETDPAIQAGSLVMELIPWYGSAALMEVNDIHNTLAKTLM